MTKNFLYKFFFNIIAIFFTVIFLSACEKTLENSVKTEQLIVKVYSSLTCPHCANFHEKVIVSLKNDNSLKDIVKFEHHSFPLEIKALNAEKILHCIDNKKKRFELLTNLYKEQRNWASGSNIDDINKALKKIGGKSGLKEEDMNSCLKDDNIQ